MRYAKNFAWRFAFAFPAGWIFMGLVFRKWEFKLGYLATCVVLNALFAWLDEHLKDRRADKLVGDAPLRPFDEDRGSREAWNARLELEAALIEDRGKATARVRKAKKAYVEARPRKGGFGTSKIFSTFVEQAQKRAEFESEARQIRQEQRRADETADARRRKILLDAADELRAAAPAKVPYFYPNDCLCTETSDCKSCVETAEKLRKATGRDKRGRFAGTQTQIAGDNSVQVQAGNATYCFDCAEVDDSVRYTTRRAATEAALRASQDAQVRMIVEMSRLTGKKAKPKKTKSGGGR